MSGETKTSLRRIRTFKDDIAAAEGRSTSEQPATSSENTVAAVTLPSEKAAPAKAFATPAASEHIPAFHELKKHGASAEHGSVAKPASASLPKINVRAKKRDLNTKVQAGGGTVITDTKRAKVNFFSQLAQSISRWLKSFGGEKKKTLTFNVSDTELRKGVVQKATSKSGAIFTADNETLKEEIRRRQSGHSEHTVASTEPHLSWTPRTETGYPLLPGEVTAPTPKRVTVEFKKVAVPQPEIVEPVAPPILEQPAWEARPQVIASAPLIEQKLPYTESNSIPQPLVYAEPAPIVQSAPASVTLPLGQTLNARAKRFLATLRVNTNTLTLSIAGVLLFAAIAALAANVVFRLVSSGIQSTPPETPAIALLPVNTITDLQINDRSQSAVSSALANATLINGVPQEFRLVDSEGVAVSTTDVLALIGFSNNLNLNQTITQAHLVTLNGQRGIVFTVTDAITAFGALLSWEPVMLPGLAGILGVQVLDGPAIFTDQTVGTTDVRVLTLGGSQRITYGFITADTVLITEDIGAFNIMVGSGL